MKPVKRFDISTFPWLRGMSHNGRVVTFTEPFWSIPFNIISVYAVLYMMELGLSEREVGLTQTILVVAQIISSFVSGNLTDLLGRRRTTFIFDSISWGLACLVWAFSNSLLGFLLAAFLNGINKVVYVSFSCMITEDATSDQRLRNYSGLYLMVIAGGFFAPLGGAVVSRMGIIPGTRLMYLLAGAIMFLMFIARHFLWKEPDGVGRAPRVDVLKGFRESLGYFMANRRTRTVFFIQAGVQFYMVFKPIFYFVYLKKTVGLSSGMLSIIPLATSIITMVVLLGFVPRLRIHNRERAMTLGLAMSAFSLVMLILAAGGIQWILIFSIMLDGAGLALIRPLLDSLWADTLKQDSRAVQLAAGNTFFSLVTVPAGIIAAELYRLEPILPFIMASLILFTVASLSFSLRRMGR
ncbi:MAG: MFS transporter [Spirochaetales bacterium]|nr:MFS transporter [Spirochaetales bacterium]